MLTGYRDLESTPVLPSFPTPPHTSPAKPPGPPGRQKCEFAVASARTPREAQDQLGRRPLRRSGSVLLTPSRVIERFFGCVETIQKDFLRQKKPL